MKWYMMLVIGFVLSVTGCAEKEQGSMDEAQMPASEVAVPTAVDEVWQNEAFVAHMHLHAEALDDLNFALADGDLEAAKVPANWLSSHDTASDVPSDWLPFLYAMRTEAEGVENAPDIATASAAAERINVRCQQCHAAIGINAQ